MFSQPQSAEVSITNCYRGVSAPWFSILRPKGWPPCFTPSKMGKEPFIPLPRLLGKGGEAALVQADLDVAVPDALQVNHGRDDVPVAHPLLDGADVWPASQRVAIHGDVAIGRDGTCINRTVPHHRPH